MDKTDDPHHLPEDLSATSSRTPARTLRLPSIRASAVLATVMLAVGVATGAAIGPAPDASLAGSASGIAQRLPLLLATLAGHARSPTPRPSAASPPPSTPQPTPRRRRPRIEHLLAAPAATTPAPTVPASQEEAPVSSTPPIATAPKSKLPAVESVWLIELAGGTFAEALAQPTAAPYITGSLIPAGTLLGRWSALSAGAFASDAALAQPVAAGATPPLLHSIVQPPCPEGPPGATCAPETPGQLTAADEFLKTTLAQITTTAAYREHGLIVVTFATVAVATQAGLPAGSSSATLTSQPPTGVVLLSPFARAGARSAQAFNPTSPRQSLEKLLR
jgi:hypothetical protein